MSTGFWFVMALNETYEKEIAVPVSLVDVPDNIIITESLPDSVRMTIRDKGYSLMPYFYGDMIEEVRLSFSSYAKGNGYGSVSVAELQKNLQRMLYTSTKIVSVKAERMEFYYNYGLSKRVPVFFDGNVQPYEQYYLARTNIQPDSVLIYASQSVLDSITEVYTDTVTLLEFKDTTVLTLPLRKMRGVKTVPSAVKVTLYADMLTEKVIPVPIVPVNMPKGYILRMFPSTANVKVVVGRSKLGLIKPENFSVTVDCRDVLSHPSDKCTAVLRSVPRGIAGATLENPTIDYLIERVE